MNEKQFDWLDDRFREAADQHEPPFDEASWQKLESRLDNSKPKRRAAWWWFTDALIVGLLVFIAYYMANTATTNPVDTKSKGEAVVAETNTTTTDPATVSLGPVISGTESSKPVSRPGSTDRLTASQFDSKVDFATTNKKTKSGQTTDLPQAVVSQNQMPNLNIVQENNNAADAAKPDAAVSYHDGAILRQHETDVIDEKANYLAAEQVQSPVAQVDAIVAKDKEAVSDNALPPSVADKKTADKKYSDKGFYIYAMGGPEWSMVAGNEAGNATFAWGLGMGYRLSPKWAVQAGYFKTQKVYAAGPGDYKPKPGTYYYNLTIKNVEADCHITEIPIALSYTLLNTKKQNLFVTAGLSSYIMKSEEYHYDYVRANSTPGYAKYTYSTNNSHLFAGLLLSGGYSFRLFEGFSLSAEPYMKVPLYGVGEGSVKIYSFGIMAGARYSLPSFRRK